MGIRKLGGGSQAVSESFVTQARNRGRTISRLRNQLIHPWVKGYKYHPILHATWIYMDIDPRP